MSAKAKKNISLARIGKPHPHKGHKLDAKTIEAIRQAHLGVKASKALKKKLSEAQKRAWAAGKYKDRGK